MGARRESVICLLVLGFMIRMRMGGLEAMVEGI